MDGSKTMTRRVIKPQPSKTNNLWVWKRTAWDDAYGQVSDLSPLDKCPYGQIGARLYGWNLRNCSSQSLRLVPSIFMPHWASRITLEITGLRFERLQEISNNALIKEGCNRVEAFIELWDSLNARRGYGWVTNPFVWVIEFKRITNDWATPMQNEAGQSYMPLLRGKDNTGLQD